MSESIILDVLLRVGFPTAVLFMVLKGWLVPGFVYDRVVKDNDRMVAINEEKVIPALIKANEVLGQAQSSPGEQLRGGRKR